MSEKAGLESSTRTRAVPLLLEQERRDLRKVLLRESRRHHFWRAALVGCLAGLVAVLFQKALDAAEVLQVAFVHSAQSIPGFGLIATLAFSVVLVAASAYLTERFAPESAGSGIPHVKAVLLNLRPLHWARILVVKFIGGFLSIAAGLSLGREGPTVHIGACIGKGVGQFLRIPRRSYATLISAGAGAGLSAAFNAPLAGFLFVLEEMRRELTPITYGTALIASASADVVTRIIIGQRPAFRIVGYPAPPLRLLPWIALLGVLAGLLGIAFNRALVFVARVGPRFGWRRAILAGAISGILVWYLPEATGGGHHTAEVVLSGEFNRSSALIVLLGLLVARFGFTVISYGAGVPGGIFAPMLVMGAYLGLAFAQCLKPFFAEHSINSPAFAVLGMAALFSASVRVPLTGIVLILEMTSNFDQLYALIVVSLTAYLVAESFRDRPVYEALLELDLRKPSSKATGSAEPVLLELYIERGSYLDGLQVGDLTLPTGSLLMSVLRGPNEFDPPAKFHIRADDVITIIMEQQDAHMSHVINELAKS